MKSLYTVLESILNKDLNVPDYDMKPVEWFVSDYVNDMITKRTEKYWALNSRFKIYKKDMPNFVGISSEDPYMRAQFVRAMAALGGKPLQRGKDNPSSINQQIKSGNVTYIGLGTYDYCKMSINWHNNVTGGFVQDNFHEGKASGFGSMDDMDGYSFLIATPLAEKFIEMLKEACRIKRLYN